MIPIETEAYVVRLSQLRLENLGAMRRMEEVLSLKGEEAVLLSLRDADEAMTSGALMEQTGLTTGRVANIFRGLEGKQLICRQAGSDDHRKVLVSLTPAGVAYADGIRREKAAQQAHFLEALGKDAPEFLRLLERCLRYFGDRG